MKFITDFIWFFKHCPGQTVFGDSIISRLQAALGHAVMMYKNKDLYMDKVNFGSGWSLKSKVLRRVP